MKRAAGRRAKAQLDRDLAKKFVIAEGTPFAYVNAGMGSKLPYDKNKERRYPEKLGASLTKEGIVARFQLTDYAANRVIPADLQTKIQERQVPNFVTDGDPDKNKIKKNQHWKYGSGILYGVANQKRLDRIRLGIENKPEVRLQLESSHDLDAVRGGTTTQNVGHVWHNKNGKRSQKDQASFNMAVHVVRYHAEGALQDGKLLESRNQNKQVVSL